MDYIINTIEYMEQELENNLDEDEQGIYLVAINALKKQIPKKQNFEICPVCEGDLKNYDERDKKYNYCPNCGQKIEW